MANELTGPTTELLQTLIRNRCVNDGSIDSGHEVRNAELIAGEVWGRGAIDMLNITASMAVAFRGSHILTRPSHRT